MMRLRMRMMMNDGKEEDSKEFPQALAWGARRMIHGQTCGWRVLTGCGVWKKEMKFLKLLQHIP